MRLSEIAPIIRSKNAGPTRLTLDVLFTNADCYAQGCAALTPQAVARAYGRAADEVTVIPVPAAKAVKIVMPRAIPAGGPFDRDVYGAQQHGPLLDMPMERRM